MATYIVGDIQGCYSGLRRLLDKVGFDPKHDMLWAVGDLIGRGSESLQTMEYLCGLENKFNCVLGNHDLHFLAVHNKIRTANPKDKFEPLLNSPKVEMFVQWLRNKPLACKLAPDLFVSHAGLYPLWDVDQALTYSEEVEIFLQSDNWVELLEHMYTTREIAWSESFSYMDKLGFIIDAFTRMRYLCEDDSLNFSCKSPVNESPQHLKPWFEHSRIKALVGTKLVFGHWAALEGQTPYDHCVALDTGYIWGSKLSILCVESMDIVSVS